MGNPKTCPKNSISTNLSLENKRFVETLKFDYFKIVIYTITIREDSSRVMNTLGLEMQRSSPSICA